MPAPPLTHHDILGLMAPFTRGGWRVDLAASDRVARRLLLRPIAQAEHDADAPLQHLELDCRSNGRLWLTRVLTHPCGLQATLRTQGDDAAALLALVQGVAPQQQFSAGDGYTLARSYSVSAASAKPGYAPVTLTLDRGEAQLPGLRLSLTVPDTHSRAADLLLQYAGDTRPDLPEDLLAVLGWHWARLLPDRLGWKSKVRLRRGALQRSRSAEQALDRAAAHLARTLAEPPAQYHVRLRAARWGVFFRRGIPTLNVTVLIGTLLVMTQMDLDVDRAPGLWMAMYHVPTALIALSFYLQELPQFEIPPWPRALKADGWWPQQAGAATSSGTLAGAALTAGSAGPSGGG